MGPNSARASGACASTADRWAVEDCSLAAQNLMLAAHSLGLGSCWVGLVRDWLGTAAGKAAIGLDPWHRPVAPIVVGHFEVAPLPWLYLKGISSGDFSEALSALLGPDAAGLSANTIGRLFMAPTRKAMAKDLDDIAAAAEAKPA